MNGFDYKAISRSELMFFIDTFLNKKEKTNQFDELGMP